MSPGVLFPWFVSMWLVGNIQSTFTDRSISGNDISNSNNKFFSRSKSKLKVAFRWKHIDFTYPDEQSRYDAIRSKEFIQTNNLPLGLEIFRDKIFISLPRWKSGVPCTLAVINKTDENKSPRLRPFPSWSWHKSGNCDGFTSVFRMSVDKCGRLWVMDSGAIDIVSSVREICPPQIVVFDAQSENLIWRYKIPKAQVLDESLFTNIVIDVPFDDCHNAYAYIADVFRYSLLVYSWKENKSWRISHPHFYPDPIVSRYNLDDVVFRWTDGIFGLALSPPNFETSYRNLYFHPLSSYREFSVSTEILRNETKAQTELDEFVVIGEPRGKIKSHASGSAMDRQGILYYNLVSQSAVGCWNSYNGPHTLMSQGIVEQNNRTLNFPNDLKVDLESNQNIWILSNRLHLYLYKTLKPNEYNFRILTTTTSNAVRNTVCQPGATIPPPETECINNAFK